MSYIPSGTVVEWWPPPGLGAPHPGLGTVTTSPTWFLPPAISDADVERIARKMIELLRQHVALDFIAADEGCG